MGFRTIAAQLLFIGVMLAVYSLWTPGLFSLWWSSTWPTLTLVPLALMLPVIVFLCRPSVWQFLALAWTLRAGRRALKRGDAALAEQHFGKAVAQAESFNFNRDTLSGTALSFLGELYRSQGRLADAEPIFQQALRHFTAEVPANPVNRATAMLNLSAVCINQGRFAEAEPLCCEALTILVNGNHEFRSTALLNLGQVRVGQDRLAAAEELTRQGLDVVRKQARPDHLSECIALSNLADILRRQDRLAAAEGMARTGLAIVDKSQIGPIAARVLNVLAEIARHQGRTEEAESLCRRSQELIEKAYGPKHFYLDGCLAPLARIRRAQGRLPEAEALLRRCVGILEALPVHPERVKRLEELAAVLRELDRPAEAEQWETQARAIPLEPTSTGSLAVDTGRV